jgi:hypothetical protein
VKARLKWGDEFVDCVRKSQLANDIYDTRMWVFTGRESGNRSGTNLSEL